MITTARFRSAIVAVALALSLPGCATIISGTSQAITINSNVPGATVTIEGNVVGVTPFSGKIARKRESVAMVSKEGHVAQPLTLTTSFNPVAILSIVWDYSTTDCLTGAAWEYSPSSYYVNLAEESTSQTLFLRESSLKALAMTYYGDLQTEIAAGTGPKLRAMHHQFFDDRTLEQFIAEVRPVAKTDAVHFGESLANLLSL